ncbi:winged helix-turn-helix transcriptional regulator [Flavobacterium soli]|uniref:winged helix-turn-helix transcriptional regulator n=1 Tax=Flavobacterium soli TaxID=344881 RepID=UPI000407F030|nr:helix-turn-helix domain-containing protein [Flavobacterium soli]
MYEKKIPKDFSCGMGITMEIIGGKWKPCLINSIHKGFCRPSELAKQHPDASKRVLNLQLKELEEHGVVSKIIYPELPPKVEYFLTDLGKSLLPLIGAMEQWGSDFMDEFYQRQANKYAKQEEGSSAVL